MSDAPIPLDERTKRCWCGLLAGYSRSCAGFVCDRGHHIGMARCWCGWAASGGDGRRELIDLGETIDDE